MGFSYLKNSNWLDITREERFFCSIAYNYFSPKPNDAIKFINEISNIDLSKDMINQKWEIGYEVALYRDLLFAYGESHQGKSNRFRKRTFDLCCFSEDGIIIIEAKAHGGFSTEQLKSFKQDREDILSITGKNIYIKIVPLISSKYSPKKTTLGYFDGSSPLTWLDLANKYNDILFKKADEAYRKKVIM